MRKIAPIMTSPIKKTKHKAFQFFEIATTRFTASSKDLDSCLAQSAGELL